MKFPHVSFQPLRRLIHPAFLYDTSDDSRKWLWLICPSLCFGIFFLHAGLDRFRVGLSGGLGVFFCGLTGLVVGAAVALVFAFLAWLCCRICRQKRALLRLVSPACGVFQIPLLLQVCSLLFGLPFAVPAVSAFGLTALLWALILMIGMLHDLFDRKLWLSLPCVTLAGIVLLSSLQLIVLFR